MTERMYGPNTLDCPDHGTQRVRSVSYDFSTTACGAYVTDGHWFHEVTDVQYAAAKSALAAIERQHAVPVPDFVGCCEECNAYWDSTTLRFAPKEVQAAAERAEATIAAYLYHRRT